VLNGHRNRRKYRPIHDIIISILVFPSGKAVAYEKGFLAHMLCFISPGLDHKKGCRGLLGLIGHAATYTDNKI